MTRQTPWKTLSKGWRHRTVSRLAVLALAAGTLTALAPSPATAADPGRICGPDGGVSDRLTVTGWVDQPRTYDADDLAALPQTTVADTYLSGGGSTSRNYTGVDLWRLLELPTGSGIGTLIRPNDPVGPEGADQHNDITRYSVVVTASDCFQAVLSMGEISPNYGGKPVVVATAQGAYDPEDLTPVTDSLGGSGFARISNPTDLRGSRRVSNIVEIRVVQAPAESNARPAGYPTCAGGVSDELTVSGAVSEERTYDLDALQALPQRTVADTYLSGGGSTSRNYTGVDLWRLLGLSDTGGGIGSLITPNLPGPQAPEPQHNDLTRYAVMVTATDCVQSLFSLAEISPWFGGKPILVATAQGAYDPEDLTPVTDSLGGSGFARISVPMDQRGARRISNVVDIKVIPAPTPEVVWPTPVAIATGTPLGAAQLTAEAYDDGVRVPGTFHPDQTAGTVLPAGTHTLTGQFVPTEPSSLTVATGVVSLVVTDPTQLAIGTGSTRVVAGSSTTVRAVLTSGTTRLAGRTVTLLARPHGAGGFAPVATTTTDGNGVASVSVRPAAWTRYQWRFDGTPAYPASSSATTSVDVTPRVTLGVAKKGKKRHGAKLVATGRTTPHLGGAQAVLWRKKGARQVLLATGVVRNDGSVRLTTQRLEPGRYKVYLTVAATSGTLEGTSPVKKVRIKRR